MRSLLALLLLSGAFAWTAWESGGMVRTSWLYALLALAAAALALFGPARQQSFAPRPGWWTLVVICGAPAWIALQTVSLPVGVVELLSPHRAKLASAMGPRPEWLTLSVAPTATLDHLMRVLACVLVFLMVRELASRLYARPWTLLIPLGVVAVTEAVVGFQRVLGGQSNIVTGTYVNRNHAAGLLALALPFALVAAIALLTSVRPGETVTLARGAAISAGIGTTLLLAAGLVFSTSRGGLAAGLAAALIMGLFGIGRRAGVRKTVFIAVIALACAGLAALPFVSHAVIAADNELPPEARIGVWKETLRMIAAYPVTGSGYGTYGSAIEEFRRSQPLYLLEYAHNDYLQWLAETGVIGLPLLVLGAGRLGWKAVTLATGNLAAPGRFIAAAAAASLAAALLIEIWDFHSYIPANALAMAWVAGIVASGEFAPRVETHTTLGVPRILDSAAVRNSAAILESGDTV